MPLFITCVEKWLGMQMFADGDREVWMPAGERIYLLKWRGCVFIRIV